jgi:hypothetical protein
MPHVGPFGLSHSGRLSELAASVEVVTARALGFALDFIANEIESAAADAVAADYIETLREAVGELDAFVRERWSEIRDAVETEKVNTAVIVCARCGEEAAARRLYSGEVSACDDCFEERLRTD